MNNSDELTKKREEKISQFLNDLRCTIDCFKLDELESILANITEDNFFESASRIEALKLHVPGKINFLSREIIKAYRDSPLKINLFSNLVQQGIFGDGMEESFVHCLETDIKSFNDPLSRRFNVNVPTKQSISRVSFVNTPINLLNPLIINPAPTVLTKSLSLFEEAVECIKKDDACSMIKILSEPTYDLEINARCNYESKLYNLVEVSCFYGSIKCFRYLVQNTQQAFINECITPAVIGGNYEIIEILEQSKVSANRDTIKTAIQYHKIDIFDWLLERFDSDYDSYYLSGLFSLCVKSKFHHGLKTINMVDPTKVFVSAVESMNILIIRLCLTYFLEMEAENYMKIAITNKRTSVMKMLLESVNLPEEERTLSKYYTVLRREQLLDPFLESPNVIIGNVINIVCEEHDLGLIRKVADHINTDLNYVHIRRTPLCSACLNDKYDVVKLLLEYQEVDVNGTDKLNPLSIAAEKGNIDIAKLLLMNPRINVNGTEKVNPLAIAVRKGNVEFVKLLLKEPNINLNGMKGNNPLNIAITSSNNGEAKNKKIVALLLEKPNIDINQEGDDNCLSNAVKKESVYYTKLLLNQLRINVNGNNSPHPLFLACKSLSVEIFELLINHRNINPNGVKGNCPLVALAEAKRSSNNMTIPMLHKLLEHPHIDINGFEDENPLTHAIRSGNNEIVDMLISNPGIDINGRGSDIPLFAAIIANNKRVIDLLLSHPNVDVNIERDGTNAILLAHKRSKDVLNAIIAHPNFNEEEFTRVHPQIENIIKQNN